MSKCRASTLRVLAVAVLLASCAAPTEERVVGRDFLPKYAQAKNCVPPQQTNAIRIYIYRPQVSLGALGSAIVKVNGTPLGNPSSPVRENILLPGAVGVVDVISETARITWVQDGRPEGTDKPIEISIGDAPIAYLRWNMRPTYGYLQQVPESQAMKELAGLRFSGYGSIPTGHFLWC